MGKLIETLLLSGTAIGLLGTIASSWYYGRKILFHYRLSTKIRTELSRTHTSKTSGFNDENDVIGTNSVPKVGDYIMDEGMIYHSMKPNKKNVENVSPYGKLDCLVYIVNKIRILEKITQTKSSGTVAGGRGWIATKVLAGLGLSREVRSGKRTSEQETVSHQIRETPWYLQGKYDCDVDIEGFLQFADYLKRIHVADLMKYFKPKVTFDNFEPYDDKAAGKDSLVRTIGYKTVEQVLQIGDKVTIIGEVSDVQNLSGHPFVTLAAPSSKSMLDLKSSRMKLLVISTYSSERLLHFVERDLRVQIGFCSIINSISLAASIFCFSKSEIFAGLKA